MLEDTGTDTEKAPVFYASGCQFSRTITGGVQIEIVETPGEPAGRFYEIRSRKSVYEGLATRHEMHALVVLDRDTWVSIVAEMSQRGDLALAHAIADALHGQAIR